MRLNQALGNGAAGGGILNVGDTVIPRLSVVDLDSPDNCSPANTVPGCAG